MIVYIAHQCFNIMTIFFLVAELYLCKGKTKSMWCQEEQKKICMFGRVNTEKKCIVNVFCKEQY
jgi:hypothetical protein